MAYRVRPAAWRCSRWTCKVKNGAIIASYQKSAAAARSCQWKKRVQGLHSSWKKASSDFLNFEQRSRTWRMFQATACNIQTNPSTCVFCCEMLPCRVLRIQALYSLTQDSKRAMPWSSASFRWTAGELWCTNMHQCKKNMFKEHKGTARYMDWQRSASVKNIKIKIVKISAVPKMWPSVCVCVSVCLFVTMCIKLRTLKLEMASASIWIVWCDGDSFLVRKDKTM